MRAHLIDSAPRRPRYAPVARRAVSSPRSCLLELLARCWLRDRPWRAIWCLSSLPQVAQRADQAGAGGREMQRLLLLPPLLLLTPPPTDAIHYPDNGDGTYSNPVMPNAHWSDPSVVRVGNLYYCVTSSIETTPSMQILESADLVNWDVVGSVSRLWVDRDPSTGQAIPPSACWSPRIMFLRGKFRVMWTQAMHHFLIAEAVDVRGPWTLVKHNLTDMSEYVFGASTFVDTTGDGKT